MASQKSKTRASDILVFLQGFFCTVFLISTAVLVAGLGLETYNQCHIVIRICIVAYLASKLSLLVCHNITSNLAAYAFRFLFLLERVHIVRCPFIDRRRDPLYVIGSILILGGFSGAWITQLINPLVELPSNGSECIIGVHPPFGFVIMAVDTAINLCLTGIFVWQLRPALASRMPLIRSTLSTIDRANNSTVERPRLWFKSVRKAVSGSPRSHLQATLMRNVVGSFVMLVSCVCFNTFMATQNFAKRGHVCMLMCLTDGQYFSLIPLSALNFVLVVVCMLVTHWLTMRSVEQESSLSRSPCPALNAMSDPPSRSDSAVCRGSLPNPGNKHIKTHVCATVQTPPASCATTQSRNIDIP
jgi:hypothetical protein